MPVFGDCPLCDKGVRTQPLIGGYCKAHFADPKAKFERTKPVKVADLKKIEVKTLKVWYDEQIKQIPAKCENCGCKITTPAGMTKRVHVAHIVPKKNVKSVQTHELNRLFLCWQCHSEFDAKVGNEQSMMNIATVAKERFETFKHLIPDNELKHVADWLKR